MSRLLAPSLAWVPTQFPLLCGARQQHVQVKAFAAERTMQNK